MRILMNDAMKLTCLSNDWLGDYRMLAEHGFSLLIDLQGEVILFDTGAGSVLERNSRVLELDLRCVQKVVLSHGHFDHTGGLAQVLSHNPRVEVHAHPLLFDTKYRELDNGTLHDIGYQQSLPQPDKLHLTTNTEPLQIAPRAWLTGEIPRATAFESVKKSFVVKRGERLTHDELLDDQALVISTSTGLILIVGCAHAGIINTIRCAMEITSQSHFRLIVGGTHLIDADEKRITATIAAFQQLSFERLLLAHCTGLEALCTIKSSLGERVSALQVGDILELPG
jgi:7,8-dihydropterin-6-yl-methyl-4-(beta-D-ribofuranosyl)aminobenzene 5'-phosphate synthase